MIIYSCIDKNEYEYLMKNGALECIPTLAQLPSESVEFAIAYKYMSDKLRARYSSNLSYPRWGWYQYEGKSVNEQPDVFFASAPYTESYLLKLDIEEYLLSDFDAWHCCLNLFPLCYSEEEESEFDYWLDKAHLKYWDIFFKDNAYTFALRDKVIKTWDRIFNIYDENDYALYDMKYKSIQAVFWRIYKEDIISVRKIMVDDKTFNEYHQL
jgi:hypothetical protein